MSDVKKQIGIDIKTTLDPKGLEEFETRVTAGAKAAKNAVPEFEFYEESLEDLEAQYQSVAKNQEMYEESLIDLRTQQQKAGETQAEYTSEVKETAEAITDAGEAIDKTKKDMAEWEAIINATAEKLNLTKGEVEELTKRMEHHMARLKAVGVGEDDRVNKAYVAEGVVRSYERERYELERRAKFDESTWQRRRAQMNEEYNERVKLRDETVKHSREEERAARQAERDWNRRKDAIKDYIQDGLAAAGAALVAYGKESYQAFVQQDTLMRQWATLDNRGEKGLGDMRREITLLSTELKVLPETLAKTAYQAESLGSKDVLGDVRVAAMAAKAGYTEADIALDALLKAQNAYAEGMYDSKQIADIFFEGIDKGAFKMEDLGHGLSTVTSAAGESQTRLEDVMAMLVVMTRQGDDFNEAAELSGLLLSQLATEGSQAAKAFYEATGQSYRDFIASGKNFGDAMVAMDAHAKKTGQTIGTMLAGDSPFYRDQQAARAAMELTGIHLNTLTEQIGGMNNAAGTVGDAYEIMANGAQEPLTRLEVAFENLKLSTGEWLNQIGAPDVINNVSQAIEWMSGATEEQVRAQVESNEVKSANIELLKEEAQTLVNSMAVAEDFKLTWKDAAGPGMMMLAAGKLAYNAMTSDYGLNEPAEERLAEIIRMMAEQSASYEEFHANLNNTFGDSIQTAELNGQILKSTITNAAGAYYEIVKPAEFYASVQKDLAEGISTTTDVWVEQALALEKVPPLYGDAAEELTIIETKMNSTATAAEGLSKAVLQTAQVSKVLDGDTLRLTSGVDIRLNAVNTPETAKEWLGKAGMPFGQEALRFTQEFLLDPIVTFDSSGTDPHGRMLASVFNGEGKSLEEGLISEGLALPMPVELTGDEELTQKLTDMARTAAEAGKGIFQEESVATAFLEGQITNMEEVAKMYEVLAAEEAEYYATYRGYLSDTVTSLEEMKQAYKEAAFEKTLLQADSPEQIQAALNMAVNTGLMTQAQADLQLQYANTMMAIEEQAAIMGESSTITQNQYETMMLLSEGLFSSREEAELFANGLDEKLIQSLLDTANQGGDTAAKIAELRDLINSVPTEVTIKFKSDTSEYLPPAYQQGGANEGEYKEQNGAVALSEGGRITGGTPGRDSVPGVLMPDEYVVKADSARSIGYDVLDQLNYGTPAPSFGSTNSTAPAGGGAGQFVFAPVIHLTAAGSQTQDLKEAISQVLAEKQREFGQMLKQVGLS